VRRDGGRVGVERERPPDPHVPEFALAAGAAVALTALAGGVLLGAGVRATVALAALGFAPFAAYAVRHSDDPTAVLPPRPVAGVAAVLAAVACLDAVRTGGLAGLPVGLAFATGLALPGAAYLVRHGDPPGSPRARAAAAGVLAALVLGVGAGLSRPVVGGVAALALSLAGVRGLAARAPPARRVRRRAVGGTVLAGAVVAAAGVAGASETVVVVGLTLALGGALGGALARPPSRKR
jgi:hypothetical protein